MTATSDRSIKLGRSGNQPLYLSTRDRSMAELKIGAAGTGKTVSMEGDIRQDIDAGRGLCLIDPMGALFNRILAYCAYRKGIGCRIPEVVVFNPSSGEWVLPFNPFQKRSGDLAVQVDRRVTAVLRAWGQQNSDETPRLEKWLKSLFTVLVECGLTIVDAGILLDQHAHELRQVLMAGLTDPFIRRKLDDLSRYRASDFLEQIESVENRLMRFLCSRTLRTMMGVGSNALDFQQAMDTGQVVLVNLAPSPHLSREQQRLIGTLVLTEFYETALTRKSGSRPYYLYVDEAARFVTPELGDALEQCRQKGLHLILAFQHLAQFRADGDVRLYKAIKNNARNKMIFAVPDREDAMELADDIFVGLTEPELKFMHRRLNHLVEDIRQSSTTISRSTSRSSGTNSARTHGNTTSHSRGTSASSGKSRSTSATLGQTESVSSGSSRSFSDGRSTARTDSESHGWSQSDSESHSQSVSTSQTASTSASQGTIETHGTTASVTATEDGDIVVIGTIETEGHGTTMNDGTSQATSSSTSQTTGSSRTHSSQEQVGTATSKSRSQAASYGRSRQTATARSRQNADSLSHSRSVSLERASSHGRSTTNQSGSSRQRGTSETVAISDQPGIRHTPFWEQDPEFWTLEEQRWRAAEIIMRQRTGECLVATASGQFAQVRIEKPRPFYMIPNRLLCLTREFYERHNLTVAQAEAAILERQAALQQKVLSGFDSGFDPAATRRPIISATTSSNAIWQRPGDSPEVAATPLPTPVPKIPKRGPKSDVMNHTRVRDVISQYGTRWTDDEALGEICDKFDEMGIPIPKTWPLRTDGHSRSWRRALENYRHLVVKAIRDRLKAARAVA